MPKVVSLSLLCANWYLFSSCSYEPEELQKYVLNLLVLSHAYEVPHLKRLCEWRLEHGLLTIDNVIDTFQLALLCDAPRLSLICYRMILKNFKSISTTEGWKIMQESHPMLEKEIVESLVEAETVSISFRQHIVNLNKCQRGMVIP